VVYKSVRKQKHTHVLLRPLSFAVASGVMMGWLLHLVVLRWGQGHKPLILPSPQFYQGNLVLTLPHVNRLRWKLFKCLIAETVGTAFPDVIAFFALVLALPVVTSESVNG